MTAAKPRSADGRRKNGEHYGAYMLERLALLDRLLVSRGWPAISRWWWGVLKRFYMSGRRRFVLRVGRRGGKSSTMCRVAVIETLYGEHVVPPGDEGTYLIISVSMKEASKRLKTIREILDMMRIEHRPLGDERVGISTRSFFSNRLVAFEAFAASISGVSGPTGIGALFDEVSKWKDKETGANPATEVLRSARPTMLTQKATAHEFMVSSPFSTLDAHHAAFTEGDNEQQIVAWAPTWVANPTETEEGTRAEERDLATWEREYKAVPMSANEVYFFDHDVLDLMARLPLPAGARTVVAGLDPAFRRNAAACVPTARVRDIYGPIDVREIVPQPKAPLVPGPTIRELAAWGKSHGCHEMVSDIHYIDSVIEHAGEVGVRVHEGFPDKETAYVGARGILNAHGFALAGFEPLTKQLKEIKSKPTPSGALKIFAEGSSTSSHADSASAFIEAVWFLAQGGGRIWLPSSMAVGGGREPGASDNRWGDDNRGF